MSIGKNTQEIRPRSNNGKYKTIHGMSRHPLYTVWYNMIKRCHDEKNEAYRWYGARGIKVCDEWKNSVESFIKDMGDRPSGYEIDRINNDGDYCKENCEWVTHKQNARNTRSNTLVEYNGRKISVAELAEKSDMSYNVIIQRVKLGWDIDKVLSTPLQIGWSGEDSPMSKLTLEQVKEIRNLYSSGGTSYAKIGKQYGVSRQTIYGIVKHKTWRKDND